MSRVFLAKQKTLGNDWIVKFIPRIYSSTSGEEDILKGLNHINLPKIIDVFYTGQGTFLVESFIEGFSLERVLRSGEVINQRMLCDWGIQIAQVLNYLHSHNPVIYHCDLKPGNIMVTYDNKLVLIDFGISLKKDSENRISALSELYAAPEQFKGKIPEKVRETFRYRFGILPEQYGNTVIDAGTDIYSLGVILYQIATGRMPTAATQQEIYNYVSPQLAQIIMKCLSTYPQGRYSNVADLLKELQTARNSIEKLIRSEKKKLPYFIIMLVLAISSGICICAGIVQWKKDTTVRYSIMQEKEANIPYPTMTRMQKDILEYFEQFLQGVSVSKVKITEEKYHSKFDIYQVKADVTIERNRITNKYSIRMQYELKNGKWKLKKCEEG